jgi:ElaB/YqjD/DUF883 family membrane-anchored ribosome-binding protein
MTTASTGNEKPAGTAEELRELIGHAEEVLRSISGQGDEAVAKLRARVEGTVRSARDRLSELEVEARTLTDEATQSADEYVRSNPWGAVAVAAAVGVVVGALLASRRR